MPSDTAQRLDGAAEAASEAQTLVAVSSAHLISHFYIMVLPVLLLLDEPTEGLSPAVVPSIVAGLASIRQLGHAVLIAESNLHHVPDFADRLYVIERGEIIFAGPPADVRKDPAVAKVVDGAG